MDYHHYHSPHASTHTALYSREGRGVQYSNHLAVDADRHPPKHTPRSSSYSSPRPSRRHSPRRSRSHVRWPPSPFVESERTSIAREFNPPPVGEAEPPCRGSVDQEPLMIDIDTPKRPQEYNSIRPEKPQAASRSRQGRSPAPPPIDTDVNRLPDFAERKPRPYFGAGKVDSPAKRSSAEILLSPQRMTPTRAASFAADNIISGGSQRRSRPPSASPARSPNTYPPPDRTISQRHYHTDESDLSAAEAVKLRSRSRTSRYSFTKAELAKQSSSTVHQADSSDESLSERIRNSKLRSTGNGASSGSSRGSRPVTPTSGSAGRPTQQPHAQQASASSYKQTAHPASETTGGINTKQSYAPGDQSHYSPHGRYPYSPPHSPQLRAVQGTASPLNPASCAGSRQNSRPTTPQSMLSDAIPPFIMFDAVNQKLHSGAAAAATMDARSRTASRLSSTVRADSIPTPLGPRIDVQSPSPQPPANIAPPYPELDIPKLPYPSLPYPDQQSPFAMPSETAFQFQHPAEAAQPDQAEAQAHFPDPVRKATLQRPAMAHRHSCAEGVNQAKNDQLSSPMSPAHGSRIGSMNATTPAAAVAPASCPRSKSSKGNNDWSTLVHDQNFNICPQCLESTVGATAFRTSFQPVHRDPGARIKCDFSRPWVRLAWLLTQKQQRPDLDLLYAVSSVSSIEPECPADEEQKRSWYGIFGDDDEPIPDFYMCSRDRRYVEALFPSLKKYIDRVSRSAHSCTMDRGSTHFGAFLDQLVEMDETARRARRAPDLHKFQELVNRVTIINNMPKCPRDTLAKGSDWHYLVSLPKFTVCPRCFVDCVAPHIRTSTRASPVVTSMPLADQFLRTAQPLARENVLTRGMGSSCQLYSPRSRRIWASVVEDNDEKYLARKVRERKAVEMGVYETYAALEKMTAAPGYDKATVKEELDRINKEWKEVE